ncbi:MAG: hypothetical protein MUC88_25065 [Planctomycetes bacterium]|nr:hypothetical protein [Planctomycetota bacterium]
MAVVAANPILSVVLHALGATSAAWCYTPQQQLRGWSWQTYWLAQASICWLLAPMLGAWITIPQLAADPTTQKWWKVCMPCQQPLRLIALNRPNLSWGLAALEHRWDNGHHGWRQDDIFMAYLGLTDAVRRGLIDRPTHHDPQERVPAFWGPNYDWTPDQDHGGVLMKTFQAMLLQTDGRKILLLPAWPKDWDADFKLRAPYQTIVEGRYRDDRLQSLQITPETRRADLADAGRF